MPDITAFARRAGRASRPLDVERQERRRHGAQRRQPGLVHAQPRHSQRGLLSARRSACTRDLGLIVTDGERSSPKKSATRSRDISLLAPGVPAFRVHNTAADGRYRIEKEILTRSVARRRAAAGPLRAARGRARRLSSLRAAGAAPGQPRQSATRRGSATTRACRCCSPTRDGTRWRWRARRRGSRDRSGSSASRTAGRNCTPTNDCARSIARPRTATSRSPARSTSTPRTVRSSWRSASVATAAEAGQHARRQPARGLRRARRRKYIEGWQRHGTQARRTASPRRSAGTPLY